MILMLHEKKGFVRSIDIAAELSVTKPSVSYATKRLRENGYINMEHDGHITLTQSGYDIAFRMYNRHKMLTNFLISIGIDEKTAREDACKMEHDLSDKSFEAMCRFSNWPPEKCNP